jgi:hypothetical protein
MPLYDIRCTFACGILHGIVEWHDEVPSVKHTDKEQRYVRTAIRFLRFKVGAGSRSPTRLASRSTRRLRVTRHAPRRST